MPQVEFNSIDTQPEYDFADGEEVLLYLEDNAGRTYWPYGETFFRATIDAHHIAYTQLDEDGLALDRPGNVLEHTTHSRHSERYGNIIYSDYNLHPDGIGWKYDRWIVPTLPVLNRFAVAELQSLGAHTMPLELARGMRPDGQFAAVQVVKAIARGKLLIGSKPAVYLHDTGDHAIGMAAMYGPTMDVLRKCAEEAVDTYMTRKTMHEGKNVITAISHALDYASFLFPQNWDENPTTDKLLNIMLMNMSGAPESLKEHFHSVITAGGMAIADGKVQMSPDAIAYHARVAAQLEEPAVSISSLFVP